MTFDISYSRFRSRMYTLWMNRDLKHANADEPAELFPVKVKLEKILRLKLARVFFYGLKTK